MAKGKIKVSGGMHKDWISTLRTSSETEDIVMSTGERIKRDMEHETDMNTRAWTTHGYKYFFGSAKLRGKWGATYVIWPMNKISLNDEGGFKARMRSTMRSEGLKLMIRGKKK